MKITQIRNATLLVEYAGQRFLIDPMLAEQYARPGFSGTVNSGQRYPTLPLPVPAESLCDVDAVIVTHTHADHWDKEAEQILPHHLPVLTCHESDAEKIAAAGFRQVQPLGPRQQFKDISLYRTGGRHGSHSVVTLFPCRLGNEHGVVLQHPEEKTLYIAGDTIWHPEVSAALTEYLPEVIVLNCGDARVPVFGSIIMDCGDVHQVHLAVPQATLVASHMEAVNHACLSRHELRLAARQLGFSQQLLIPEDGEMLSV